MPSRFRRTFFEYVCQVQAVWFLSLTVLTALLVLTVFSLVVVDTSADIYSLVLVNLAIILGGIGLNVATLYLCKRTDAARDLVEQIDAMEDPEDSIDDRNLK